MKFFRNAVLTATLGLSALGLGAEPLRFGVLSDVDSLPFLVARDEGLYTAAGLEVKLVPFQSPVERDAAFQAGAVDGVIGDVLGAALAVQNGFPVAIAAATDGRYALLVGPEAKNLTVRGLAGTPVAGSSNTVIHYLVHRFLTEAGVPPAEVKLLAVPKMPVRLEMVLGGQVSAAGLPEPMATVAVARGARVLADSDSLGADPGAVLFTRAFLDTRSADAAAFLKAAATAGARINADNGKYRPYLTEKAGFPAEAAQTFRFVAYRPVRLPSDAAVNAITGWMVAQGLLKTQPAVDALVDRRAAAVR